MAETPYQRKPVLEIVPNRLSTLGLEEVVSMLSVEVSASTTPMPTDGLVAQSSTTMEDNITLSDIHELSSDEIHFVNESIIYTAVHDITEDNNCNKEADNTLATMITPQKRFKPLISLTFSFLSSQLLSLDIAFYNLKCSSNM